MRTTDDEVDSCPLEDSDALVVVDKEKVHRDENDPNEHPDEAQGEEELSGHKER